MNNMKRMLRLRKKLKRYSTSPRLTVFRSNRHIYAQIIDDINGCTITSESSIKYDQSMTNRDMSFEVGKKIAEQAIQAGIFKVCFDRSYYKYHGRIAALADGARQGGLIF